MKISFLVNEVAGGWEPIDTRLGGTEESVVRWAEEMARLGHTIEVYRNGHQTGWENTPLRYKGSNSITYLPRDLYVRSSNRADICINIKSSDIAPLEPTLYLTNETNASDLDLDAYLGVIWPSQWAVDNIPVNNKTFILPHGYAPTHTYPQKKIPKQCFYASSPDRGLDTLLEVWPEVVKAHPDATLLFTYGSEAELDMPGVINLGEADEETMDELYRTSDIWAYPCNGGELFCITGKKAQAAACIPVIIPVMALKETVKRGFFVDDASQYAQTLIEVLDMPMEIRNVIRSDVKRRAYTPTWEESTDKLLEIINSVIVKP